MQCTIYRPKDVVSADISDRTQSKYRPYNNIYSQATELKNKLTHLTGLDYHKSNQYLVTDFLKVYSDDESVIID